MPNGKTFTIEAKNNSQTNIYIQSITLNGKPYDKVYITHDEMMKGGNLTFNMGATPNKNFERTLRAGQSLWKTRRQQLI